MPEVRTTSSTGGQKGVKLARFDLIPAGPLRELAEHYGKGAAKYAEHQWRQGYEWSKSIAAIGRHYNDFMAGKDYDVCSNDPDGCAVLVNDDYVLSFDRRNADFIVSFGDDEPCAVIIDGSTYDPSALSSIGEDTCYNHTGSHHMVAVAWHSLLLLEFKDTHPEHDDRYIPGGGKHAR